MLGFRITVWAQEVHSSSALLWISHRVSEIGLTVVTKPSSIPPPESQKTRLQSHSLEPYFHTAVNSPLLLSDSYSTEYLMLEKNPKLKLHFPIFFFSNVHLSLESHLQYLLQKWNLLQKNKPNSRTINLKRK